MTGATGGAGTVYHSAALEFTRVILEVPVDQFVFTG
jgi:hypothetical protein